MKHALAFLITLSLGCAALASQPATTTDGNLESTLKRIARERILQFDRGDRHLWSPYVASGYLIATPSGAIQTRAQVMDGFEPPREGYHDEFSFEDVHVRRDGDTAVMSYVIDEAEFWDDQKYVVPKLRKTDTFVLRNGRWLILASQETFMPAPFKEVSIDPGTYPQYAGRYRLMHSLVYEVSIQHDRLLLKESDKPDWKVLRPLSKDVFFTEGAPAQFIFVRDAGGHVTHFLIRDNGYDIKVPRIREDDT
ncbi:MAG: hypothetical protein OJF55_000094 [Rhodanobacteraceae bacterium]|jgi:hypothetical protein|nr:MAG: hypothetical protein OJF55_000094 [Rhodanobacteraceae bacterium]